jgi:mannosyltransferase OCH1-like enzyme
MINNVFLHENNLKAKIRQLKYKRLTTTTIPKIEIRSDTTITYNSIIPLNIYQTWHTKNLSEKMTQSVNCIKKGNPGFNYYLYDDNDCRNFIYSNFETEVLNAFDKLIPGAYKADLWRYCILYKNGGIYLDLKYTPISGFKFLSLTEKEHWVLDVDGTGIYNALIVCQAGNEILLRAINTIVDNVKNNFYGTSALEPTGPKMLSHFFTNMEKRQFDLKHDFFESHEHRVILFNNKIILKSYEGYLLEHEKLKKVPHYSTLWRKRLIYRR